MLRLVPLKRKCDEAGLVETLSRPCKRNFTFPIVTPRPENHDRHISEAQVVDSLDELRLCIPPIETLPQELLLQVFGHLVHPSLVTAGFPDKPVAHYSNVEDYLEDGMTESWRRWAIDRMPIDREDLRNVCLVSRKFRMAATTLLYRCAHFATAKSPGSFLLTLTAHPGLQPLVKHISVPQYMGCISDRFDFAFSHDTTNWRFGLEEYLIPHEIDAESLAECGEYLGGGLLRLMMPLVPNLRTLVIPQTNLLDGPFTQTLVLPNLTMLRITLMTPNEVTFFNYGFAHAVRTITWLAPSHIGHHFPALRRLEICTPNGQWEADLVSEEVDTSEGKSIWKYVESLTTTTTSPLAAVDWDLMSLKRPIFNSSKLRTLEFDGPGMYCPRVFNHVAHMANWNFDRFLNEKGSGLRTLSLDWEYHDIGENENPYGTETQEVYFGPEGRLTNLINVTNLTRLTVSLQAIFGNASVFWDWADEMRASPEAELAKLLPPSLRTLRIAEYIPGVYEETWDIWEYGDEVYRNIQYHGRCVFRFLQALRTWWLSRDEGRELWFRRYADLDQLEMNSGGASLGRSGIAFILDYETERDERFERVLHPHEEDNSDDDSDDDGTADGSDDGTTENEDDDPGGESEDQWSDGEKVGVYQDGKLVLV